MTDDREAVCEVLAWRFQDCAFMFHPNDPGIHEERDLDAWTKDVREEDPT